MRRLLALGCVFAACVAATPAQAATVIGQVPPFNGTPLVCGPANEVVQTAVSAGATYTVPGPGVITSWSSFGNPSVGPNDEGDQLALRIYEPGAAAGTFKPVFESSAEVLHAPFVGLFKTRFPVHGGELLGLRVVSAGPDNVSLCQYQTPSASDTVASRNPFEAVGAPGPFGPANPIRLDVSATVEPDKDGDGFGDESQDKCDVQASTQGACDLRVTISKKPKRKTSSTKASFEFSAPGSVELQCALDKDDFAQCSSPVALKKLKPRKHTFRVMAVDPSGTPGTPASVKWVVTK